MRFNTELARKLKFDDRDVAPFFAGRQAEIKSFENALESAEEKSQAVFRIYQGAPGCGKTSLAFHLPKITAETTIFTRFSETDNFDKASLAVAIHDAVAAENKPTELVKEMMELAMSLIGKDETAQMIKAGRVKHVPKNAKVVIHIDEAHSMGEKFDGFLKALHVKGVGWPCVVLLTGLNQTRSRVVGIKGLSRLAKDVTINMGAMAHEECVASTMDMLGAIGAIGDREDAARRTASLSFGWPQHLTTAQEALRDELIREEIAGDLSKADFARIKRQSGESRASYYKSRIEHGLPSRNKALTLRMLDALRTRPICMDIQELGERCAQIIESHPQTGRFQILPDQGLDYAEALIQKGVVVETDKGFEIAIPSMGDWAANLSNAA